MATDQTTSAELVPATAAEVAPSVGGKLVRLPVTATVASSRYTGRGLVHVVGLWAYWVWQPDWSVQVKAIEGQSAVLGRDVKRAKKAARKGVVSLEEFQALEKQAGIAKNKHREQRAELRKSRRDRLATTVGAGAVTYAAIVVPLSVYTDVPPRVCYGAPVLVLLVVLMIVGFIVTDRTMYVEDSAMALPGPHGSASTVVEEVEPDDPFPLSYARNATEAVEAMRRALVEEGLRVARIEPAIRHRWGWEIPVILKSGKPADLIDRLDLLETILGLGAAQIHAVPDPALRARVVLRCILRDPFADMEPLPIARPNSLSITQPLPLAHGMDGQVTPIHLHGANTIVVASSGAGKSVLLRKVGELLTACDDTVPVDIDVSGGDGLDCFERSIKYRARTHREAEELLSLMVAIAKVRPGLRRQLDMDDESWVPSRRYPAIKIVGDEFPRLNKKCKALMVELQQIGRKSRVTQFDASQSGGKDALGAAMADAMPNRLMMACQHKDVVAVLGPGMLANGWRPDRLRPAIGDEPYDAGIFYLLGGGNNAPVPSKVDRITLKEARQVDFERANSRPDIDQESMAAARALLATGQALVSETSLAAVVVADMLAVLGDEDRMESQDMIESLRATGDPEYANLDQAKLTAMLAPLGLSKRAQWRVDGNPVPIRGYTKQMLEGM